MPAEVAYVAGQGGKVLADDPRLHLCRQCDAEELKVTVVMATKDMGKGCERDQYSMTARRKLCGQPCVFADAFRCSCCSPCLLLGAGLVVEPTTVLIALLWWRNLPTG